jgi:L-ornithine N5-oxygenase
VTAALRRYAYKPADESHFVNRIFHPDAVDFLYDLAPEVRKSILGTHADTNYSAVDLDLIKEIYVELYNRKVAGDTRVRIENLLELKSVTEDDDKVVAHFQSRVDGSQRNMEADAVILATGFMRRQRHALLDPLTPHLELDGSYKYKVDRYYRVACRSGFQPKIYLQGFCEDTHGLSDTLLSVLPMRSQEILHSMFHEATDAFAFAKKDHAMLGSPQHARSSLEDSAAF